MSELLGHRLPLLRQQRPGFCDLLAPRSIAAKYTTAQPAITLSDSQSIALPLGQKPLFHVEQSAVQQAPATLRWARDNAQSLGVQQHQREVQRQFR